MDGLVAGQILVIRIRNLNRAIPDTGIAPRTDILNNVAGFFNEGYLKISCVPFDAVNFRIG